MTDYNLGYIEAEQRLVITQGECIIDLGTVLEIQLSPADERPIFLHGANVVHKVVRPRQITFVLSHFNSITVDAARVRRMDAKTTEHHPAPGK